MEYNNLKTMDEGCIVFKFRDSEEEVWEVVEYSEITKPLDF